MTPAALKAARDALGLTQSQLAAALKTSDRTVRKWENAERAIPGPVEAAVEMMLEKK